MRRSSRRDDGATHVLEAVTVTLVMVASVAYVVTFESPAPPHTEAQRAALDQKARDALGVLAETPLVTPLGNDLLAVSLHECLQGDCSRLADKLDKMMPLGSRYGVHITTKEGTFPLYEPHGEPPGEAVSSVRSFEPGWSYQFLGLSQSVYDPTQDPLVVYGLPIFSGDVVHQGSSALRIDVHGTRADNAVYILKGSATTRAVDAGGPVAAATSLYFHAGDGAPLAARDVRATTIGAGGAPTQAPVPFRVRVEESAGGAVPVGTQIQVHVPHGWSATAKLPANDADWTWVADATDKSGTATGSTIVAKLKRAVSSGSVDLAFDAVYHGDATDHYPFTATLSSGAYAQAQTIVRADAHAMRPLYEVPLVAASVPRPLGVGATTTWTLAVVSPDPVRVTRIEIAEEDARAIFGGVAGISGPGSWAHAGDKLVWTGDVVVSHDAPLALAFRVTASALGSPATERAPFTPSVDLGGHDGRLDQSVAPGLYRGIFLPSDGAYSGYDPTIGGGSLRDAHAATSTAVYRSTALPGAAQYEVGHVLGLRDSVFGSSVSPERRAVEPGGTARLNVDVQSVMYELAVLGLTPSIDVYVYPPWSGDERKEIEKVEVYDGTLARGSDPFLSLIDLDGDLMPDATDVGRHAVNVDVPRGWLYGPYVVEARVSWLETLTAILDGVPVTEDVVRTASVYDYVLVKPAGEAMPSSAIYDVHLIAWLQEWR